MCFLLPHFAIGCMCTCMCLRAYYNGSKPVTTHLNKRRGTTRKGTCFPCEMVIVRGTENWKEHKRHYIWTKLFKTAVPKLRSRAWVPPGESSWLAAPASFTSKRSQHSARTSSTASNMYVLSFWIPGFCSPYWFKWGLKAFRTEHWTSLLNKKVYSAEGFRGNVKE